MTLLIVVIVVLLLVSGSGGVLGYRSRRVDLFGSGVLVFVVVVVAILLISHRWGTLWLP